MGLYRSRDFKTTIRIFGQKARSFGGLDDRNNTIAGWVLFGGIAALGLSIVTGMYFAPHRLETMGYVVEGVEQEGEAGGAEAEPPITKRERGVAGKRGAVRLGCGGRRA